MKIKSRKKKSPTIILTPELQHYKSHGMGCLFEDDIEDLKDKITASPEYLCPTPKEPHCPICGSPLDFNAYEDKYKCLFCGYESEPFRKFTVLHPEEN